MSILNPDPQPSAFARLSEKESICQSCFRTVQGDGRYLLEDAEEIHADVCLMKYRCPDRDTLD